MVATFLLGALYVVEVWVIVRLVRDPEGTRQALREVVTNQSVAGWKSVIVVGLVWFFDVLNGILLLACAWLLFRKREVRATALGRIALLFSLTVVNVLAAYFDVEEVLVACADRTARLLGHSALPDPVPRAAGGGCAGAGNASGGDGGGTAATRAGVRGETGRHGRLIEPGNRELPRRTPRHQPGARRP